MAGGYTGKILKVELTTENIKKEGLSEGFYRTWLGTYGLAARIIYSDITPRTDPLGPGNILGLTTGLLTGTATPFSGSFTAAGKSPLTGGWGDARGGGYWGPELKFAGFDAVFFYGRSNKPVYLWVSDGEAELRDASHIWGKDTSETEDILKEQHKDKRVQVAGIGPSGEKLSKISCIITDKGRAAGRSGLGTVMGSKNLKAVAVRGTGEVPVANKDKLTELRKRFIELGKTSPFWTDFSRLGTCGGTAMSAFSGDSPVKNWGGSGKEDFPTASKISDENVIKYDLRTYACYGCPIGCGGLQKIETGPYKCEGHRPEYETLAAFGTMNLNDNVESIIYLNDVCNRYGLDTISAGCTISFAIECYENGVVTKEDMDGIELTWGNAEAIVRMTEKLARREGFGDVLADGVKIAAEKIGKGAEKYAMHVGGQEVPMHDPRLGPGLGTTYVANPTPARHTQGSEGMAEAGMMAPMKVSGVDIPTITPKEKYDPHGKAEIHALVDHFTHVCNALGVCMFWIIVAGIPGIPEHRDFVNAVTGWNIANPELLGCGERIACMRQAFNVREGLKPADFKLPKRILGKPPLKAGPLKGVALDIDTRSEEYFRHVDWDLETGKPSKKKLTELGLGDVARDLWG